MGGVAAARGGAGADAGLLHAQRAGRSRSRSRRSTRATSSTTDRRDSSPPPTTTRRSCSATTSTRTASSGSPRPESVAAVHDLAELISLCAQARAEGHAGEAEAWAATAALLGRGSLAEGRRLLRDEADPTAPARARAGGRRRRGGRSGVRCARPPRGVKSLYDARCALVRRRRRRGGPQGRPLDARRRPHLRRA